MLNQRKGSKSFRAIDLTPVMSKFCATVRHTTAGMEKLSLKDGSSCTWVELTVSVASISL